MSQATIPQESREMSRHLHYEFSWVMHWVGVAILAYFLVDLVFQAWPVALIQPAWLDKMIGFLISRGITPLTGLLLVAGAAVLNPLSTRLSSRATLARRLAIWVAMGYLLLIPVQVYSGVKILQARQQESAQLFSQAARSVELIKKSTTPAELRSAYEQVPGNKPALPEDFPEPFPVIRERLVESISANTKRIEYEFKNAMSDLWQRSLALITGNILRMLIFFLGFAAMGRRSPDHPALLQSLLTRKQGNFRRHGNISRQRIEASIPNEWLDMDENQQLKS